MKIITDNDNLAVVDEFDAVHFIIDKEHNVYDGDWCTVIPDRGTIPAKPTIHKIAIYGSGDAEVNITPLDKTFDKKRFCLYRDGVPFAEINPHYNGKWTFSVAPASDEDEAEFPSDMEITRQWGTLCSYSETVIIACSRPFVIG